jgi:hypothetical protein
LTIFSRRNVIVFLPLYLPVITALWTSDPAFSKIRANNFLRTIIIFIAVVIVAGNWPKDLKVQISQSDPFKIDQPDYPSLKIIERLRQLPAGSRFFAAYGYGGYLDYQLPQDLVFIDGRNSSYWQLDNKLAVTRTQEILKNPDQFEQLLDKYQVKAVILGDGSGDKKPIWQNLGQKLESSGRWQRQFPETESWSTLYIRQ